MLTAVTPHAGCATFILLETANTMPPQETSPGEPLFLPTMILGLQGKINVGDSMSGADCPQGGQSVYPGVELEQIVLGKPLCDDIMPNGKS